MSKIDINPNLFRSLDIRGANPEYICTFSTSSEEELLNSAHAIPLREVDAFVIGRAIATSFTPKKVVVGYDARLNSKSLTQELIRGLRKQGVNVDLIGLSATDKLYFAVGKFKYDLGVEVTGSHTIKHLNGFKIVRYKDGKVYPVAKGLGMEKLKEAAISQKFARFKLRGKLKNLDISKDFEQHILQLFDYSSFKNQKIVLDAGNGVAGESYSSIIDKLPLEFIKLNFVPDGNFPNHEPDPIIVQNNHQLISKVESTNADFGIAWDGDADRIALITKSGELITGSFFAPLLLPWVLKQHPHATVIATLSMGHALADAAEKENARVKISEVGNSNVTLAMDQHDAPFAAEEADHFMFKETYNSESGILPLLIVLDRITSTGKNIKELLAEARNGYFVSGDVNLSCKDSMQLLKSMQEFYQKRNVPCLIRMGDLEVHEKDYYFSLHPSFNDPVVRLNLEAKSEDILKWGIEEVKNIAKEYS